MAQEAAAAVASFNEAAARSFLTRNNWPSGLQQTFIDSVTRCPMRYMIVDDSGSMATEDGNRRISNKMVKCSRWSELVDAMLFHAELARDGNLATEFRLLNKSAPLVVSGTQAGRANYEKFKGYLKDSPSGGTPLCRHISEIVRQIQGMEGMLRENGHKAVLVIATDGESSDGDIAAAMRPLQTLPVWVVVRLCTDDEKIVNYWNGIDSELEVEMDVLDDFSSEAEEVTKLNSWLTYGEPLHRMREFGVAVKEFDLLDEARLTKEQLRGTVRAMFGGELNDYPHPDADWTGFVAAVQAKVLAEQKLWCPRAKMEKTWIDMSRLEQYNSSWKIQLPTTSFLPQLTKNQIYVGVALVVVLIALIFYQ